ncbi:MAG: sirohydrochlorin chelatase [Planctomycetia bacterium]
MVTPSRIPEMTMSPGEAGPFGESDGVGLLVVGHGTADPVGAQETRAMAQAVAGLLPGRQVELGFLEVIGPTIDDAVQALADRGCRRVVVAPLLLFTAGHAVRDVPEAVLAAVDRRGMTAVQSAALGCHPAVVELARARRRESLAGLVAIPMNDTVLVMVGRGSSVPDAVDQFREFAEATLADGGMAGARLEIGFVAAARPTLAESLEAAAAGHPRRVVVQPHILFQGHVEDQVTAAVLRCRIAYPEIEWIQVSRLGADRQVGRAIVDRAIDATAGTGRHGALFSAAKNLSPEAG